MAAVARQAVWRGVLDLGAVPFELDEITGRTRQASGLA